MAWSFCRDAQTFLEKRREVLSADESLNCLAWAAIERSLGKSGEGGHSFLCFEDGPVVQAHAFVGHRRGDLVLGPMSELESRDLADVLASHGTQIRIAEGPREAVLSFSRRWSAMTGAIHEHTMDQGLYELRRVEMPDLASGQLVRAETSHRANLAALVEGFAGFIADEPMTAGAIAHRVDRFLEEQCAFLWLDAKHVFVAMAAIVRQSPSASSISCVYTLPEHRRKGHAARVVAMLSQAQLDAGKAACNLHTDLSNPTSNGVYRRIGYRKIAESLRLRLSTEDRHA